MSNNSEEEQLELCDEVRRRNFLMTERAVAKGRWFIIAFLLLYLNVVKPDGTPLPLVNGLLLLVSVYNALIHYFTTRAERFTIAWTYFSMYCDITAVAVGLFFTDGVKSHFFFIWYLTLFIAAARFGFVRSLSFQIPMGAITTLLIYRDSLVSGPAVFGRLVPMLFSLSAVSVFGATLFREERYTIEVVKMFHRASITDRLTGLHNYSYFIDALRKEQARSERAGACFAVAIFDLDFFKNVNDTYGHEIGNRLLREVAKIMLSNARQMDTVARYGGEEFIVVMPDSDGAEMEVAERIRRKVEKERFTDITGEGPLRITVSAGVASYPADASTMFELLDKADQALYQAKNSGRNKVCGGNETAARHIVGIQERGRGSDPAQKGDR